MLELGQELNHQFGLQLYMAKRAAVLVFRGGLGRQCQGQSVCVR